MWANTGDAISKQYAGTVALKVCTNTVDMAALSLP